VSAGKVVAVNNEVRAIGIWRAGRVSPPWYVCGAMANLYREKIATVPRSSASRASGRKPFIGFTGCVRQLFVVVPQAGRR
jgi:hypothetical protein